MRNFLLESNEMRFKKKVSTLLLSCVCAYIFDFATGGLPELGGEDQGNLRAAKTAPTIFLKFGM